MVSDAYKNPYLNLAGEATSSTIGYSSRGVAVNFASYTGKVGDDYSYRFGTKKNVSGVYEEMAFASDDKKGKLAISSGVMNEQNSLLGSEASGAFGIDKSSTYHAGIAGSYEIADGVSLIGNYNLGLTRVSASGDSIFTNFGNITTNSMAAGVEFADVRVGCDMLGFTASQPLRVTSGRANLTLPVDVAADGSAIYQKQNLNLSPTARELDLESYYNYKFGQNSALSLNAIYRMNPNNDNSLPNEAALLGKYRLEF